ncbi:hypothetical protein [Dyella silvae]|uniref:hypothetical protein n=1 Tax=Dyella silvae TaxID=2994424 RepID=UPI002264F869|nr:hypothetical protein [Dyella silvae]
MFGWLFKKKTPPPLPKSDPLQPYRGSDIKEKLAHDDQRMLAAGIKYAIWLSSGAPCADDEMTALHQKLDGKRYSIAKGMRVGKRYIRPGIEDGCRCYHKAVIPGFKE